MLTHPAGEAEDCAKSRKFGKRGDPKGQHCAMAAYGGWPSRRCTVNGRAGAVLH